MYENTILVPKSQRTGEENAEEEEQEAHFIFKNSLNYCDGIHFKLGSCFQDLTKSLV